jgi:hypothetical protein
MYKTCKFSVSIFTSVLLLIMLCNTAAAQTKAGNILALQQKRFAAMISKDTGYLRKCTDEGIVYIHSNGLVQDKAAFINSVGGGTIVYEQMINKEQQVRMYKKAAIINGIVHVKGTINGNNFEVDLRYTDVYVNIKGWKMAAWQSLKL